MDKEEHRKRSRDHYYTNKQSYRERHKKRRDNYTLISNELKQSKGCYSCEESDLAVLDFHHIHGKDLNVSCMRNYSIETVKLEIFKCVVLCSNCHRKLHYYGNEINVDLDTYWNTNTAV